MNPHDFSAGLLSNSSDNSDNQLAWRLRVCNSDSNHQRVDTALPSSSSPSGSSCSLCVRGRARQETRLTVEDLTPFDPTSALRPRFRRSRQGIKCSALPG